MTSFGGQSTENCVNGNESTPFAPAVVTHKGPTARPSHSWLQSGAGGGFPSPATPSFLPPEAQTPCLRPGPHSHAHVHPAITPLFPPLTPESRTTGRGKRCLSINPARPELNAAPQVSAEARLENAQIRTPPVENPFIISQQGKPLMADYLKRTKRDPHDPKSNVPRLDGPLQPPPNIGIIDSPVKGRRLALFQETSDESFEESLMAGGYGRYRSDALPWRQPENESPNPISAEPSVTSEREMKKKSRLAAFLDIPRASSSKTQLVPFQVEGRGRVLVCVGAADPFASPRPSPLKGRRSRKRKKVALDAHGEWGGAPFIPPANLDGPNWPDTLFPWGPRFAQQSPEEEERLRYIESFLDGDSDAEEGPPSRPRSPVGEVRPGQGKLYPLSFHFADHREGQSGSTTMAVIPSDPADARTALLSKKSVREFYLRLLRRRNTDSDGDGEAVCICNDNDPDDDRASVQCDLCCTWYHLDCIGIRSTAQLGREEDPWFCANCADAKTPPPVTVPLMEPTFVPTDQLNVNAAHDPPFYQGASNPSPGTVWTSPAQPPKTPPRSQSGPHFSSGSSWDEPSCRGGPHTPQLAGSQEVRVYTTPGWLGMLPLEESPFDPTSTPSRGIQFGAPFATPKNGLWPGRTQDLFHTPTRPGEIAFGRHFARGNEEDTSVVPGVSPPVQDMTPLAHTMKDGGRAMESPLAAKRSRQSMDTRIRRS